MASIDKISVKDEEYVINEEKWADYYSGFEYIKIDDNFSIMKKGRLCILRVYDFFVASLSPSATSWKATLPEGIVPSLYMSSALVSSGGKAYVSVDTNRHIQIQTSNEALNDAVLNGQIVFPIK